MGFLASALDDTNAEAISTYNAYSPSTAQGINLSSVVKINGLQRDVPTYSTVPVMVVGQAYLGLGEIQSSDGSGNVWTVPAVTIPSAGQIASTATCGTLGDIQLGSGVVLTVMNPTRGLQSVTTTAVATVGSPVETDAQLRLRQAASTQIPSSTMLGSIVGALWTIPGVTRLRPYQNETDTLDSNGVPGFSLAVVIEGGDAQTIANTIAAQKFACGTFGTTTETVVDDVGVTHAINFFYATQPPIVWVVNIHPGPQYSTNTDALIQQSMAAWTNLAGIGTSLQLMRAAGAAYLGPSITATATALQAAVSAGNSALIATLTATLANLNAAQQTYEVMSILVGKNGGTPAAADAVIAFNEDAYIAVNSDGTLVSSASVVVNLV